MKLVRASLEQVRAVLARTHALWSEGMTLVAYEAFWQSLLQSPWGRENFRYLLWTDERGEWVSSFKLYTISARLRGRRLRLAGIGAVFTPEEQRGLGYARSMLLEALSMLRDESFDAALLFSDIGTPYYSELGFKPVPSNQFQLQIPIGTHERVASGKIAEMDEPDWNQAKTCYRSWASTRQFSLLREDTYWQYLYMRGSLNASPPDGPLRILRIAAQTDSSESAYTLFELQGSQLRLLEAIGPSNAAGAAITRMIGWASRHGIEQIVGWWNDSYSAGFINGTAVSKLPRTKEIAMIAPLSANAEGTDWTAIADPFFQTDHF